jgi:hypothetical protein
MSDPLRHVALAQFRQVEAGGKMLAFTREQDSADALRKRCEELFYSNDRFVIEGIAFVRAVETQNGDCAFSLGNKR